MNTEPHMPPPKQLPAHKLQAMYLDLAKGLSHDISCEINELSGMGFEEGPIWIYLAQQAYRDGRFDLAAQMQLEAIRSHGETHDNYYGLGMIYLAGKLPDQAIKAFYQAVRLAPQEKPGWERLIELGVTTQRLDLVQMSLEAYLLQLARHESLEQEAINFAVSVANHYLQSGQTPVAKIILELILRQFPENEKTLWALGGANYRLRNHELAEECYRQLIKVNSDVPAYHEGLHFVLRSLNKLPLPELMSWEEGPAGLVEIKVNGGIVNLDERVYQKPKTVCIEVSSACNYQCPVCTCGNGHLARNKPYLNADEFKQVLEILNRERIENFNLFCIGEPFMNPDIYDIVETAADRVELVEILTNGSLIDVDRLRPLGSRVKLHFSLDSIDYKSYAYYRRCSREHFLAALDNLKRLADTDLQVAVSILVMRHNQDQIEEISEYLDRLGLPFSLAAPHCSPFDVPPDKLPPGMTKTVNDGARRYVTPKAYQRLAPTDPKWQDYNAYQLDPETGLYCNRNWLTKCTTGLGFPWVTSDGDLLPCCLEGYVETTNFGNIFKAQSFSALWFSKEYLLYRNQLLNLSEASSGYCRWCPTAMMF